MSDKNKFTYQDDLEDLSVNKVSGKPPLDEDPVAEPMRNPVGMNSGLNYSGEFRIADKITFGIRNAMVLLRYSPTGQEVEVLEGELADMIYEAFFEPIATPRKGTKLTL